MEYRKLGRFHLGDSIAKGGMGEIVKSIDDAGRPIALKTILEDHQEDPKFRDLFLREAEITFLLHHPNIVKAFRFDEVGNRLVLALEYLEGVNLKDILRLLYERDLKMPLSVAVAIMEKSLLGLQYAHDKKDTKGKHLGIVHRDLNPSNVFITYKGQTKILDFGISKATQKDIHQLTPKNEIRGKVCYLSPEQIKESPTDYRSDIFSLGIVLWEMLAGRPLYFKDTDGEVMDAIVHGEYNSLREFRPDIPAEFENLIRKALSTNPKNRFQSCEAFRLELLRVSGKLCMPAASDEDVSVFVQSVFNRVEDKHDPVFQSGYAWLMAQIPGQVDRGISLARKMAEEFPTRPLVQLNLARSLLLTEEKSEALRLLRRLARVDAFEATVHPILEYLGVRRKPVFAALSRSHPLNYICGKIRHRIKGPTPYQEQFLAA